MAKQGLSIKLIHDDSPESPFYQPNLTQSERTRKLILLTKARANYFRQGLQAAKHNYSSNAVRQIVGHQMETTYIAKLSIDTFKKSSPISYYQI